MTLSLAQNAIALLIDLAERGEIDPWDVQVVEVIDRFLSKLQPVRVNEEGRAPYEADLLQSGQAFLYASMLLLLKADTLARLEAEATEEVPSEEFLDGESFLDAPLPLNLERRIRRRATSPPAQNRRVTLQELIAQLNVMAAAVADPKPQRGTIRRPRPQSRTQAIRAIAQLAHQENLSEVAAALDQFLALHWQEINQDQEWCEFEILLEMWVNSELYDEIEGSNQADSNPEAKSSKPKPSSSPRSPASSNLAASTTPSTVVTPATTHDRVGVFWALLFLSAQSKVELAQETFYEDLKVRSLKLDE
ncbi:MAG: segregation/condensation protein A [Oculatellaceae cyanobacterium Prado106]|jgi:segregation and condensation protein A|nr:segregation/condensation protein A [Oculatellaceae cyanobacterium Prado106]